MNRTLVWGGGVFLLLTIAIGAFLAYDSGFFQQAEVDVEKQQTGSTNPLQGRVTPPESSETGVTPEPQFVRGVYNVGFKKGVSATEAREIVISSGGQVLEEIIFDVVILNVRLLDKQADELPLNAKVEWLERDYILTPSGSVSEWPFFNFEPFSFINEVYGAENVLLVALDSPGHGGTVLAAAQDTLRAIGATGVNTRLIDVTAGTSNGTTESAIALGFLRAISDEANVINLSVGLFCVEPASTGGEIEVLCPSGQRLSQTLTRAIAAASDGGAIVVVSAGNTPGIPSGILQHPDVIGVGSLEQIIFPSEQTPAWCTFSDGNYGGTSDTQVDFYASPNISGTQGTSFSAPRIAARAASLLASRGDLSRSQVMTLLKSAERASWTSTAASIYVSGDTLFSDGVVRTEAPQLGQGTCLPTTLASAVTPTCRLTATPATLPAGGGLVTLTWSAPNATGLVLSQYLESDATPVRGEIGSVTPPTAGTRSVTVNASVRFEAAAQVTNFASPVTCQANVAVAVPTQPPSNTTTAPPVTPVPLRPPTTSVTPTVQPSSSGALDGAIVPTCEAAEGGFVGACQLCDLVKLARNIINFSIAFSVVAATLLFAYAGFMYFTAASSPDNIKKAHGIFTKTLAGIVIILASWLVVNLLMQTVSGNRYSLSDDIVCLSDAYTPTAALPRGGAVSGGGTGESCGTGTGVPYNEARETSVRQGLAANNPRVDINNGGVLGGNRCDAAGETTGCTNVGGLSDSAVNYIKALARAHPTCTLVVTGGSEGGHCEHNQGNAFDLRTNCDGLNTAVYAFPNGISPSQGAYWNRESNPDHWHVCVTGRGTCR